jgi:Ni2+-binding GTPase involved in maturation of urease and hydrogenase
VENVGNLVCPASFDLGEHHKVVVLPEHVPCRRRDAPQQG